ncbi:HNH endonuclease family protein [Streptomyces sp. NPDC020951]|uniref:HNH endonuclease family protein n=1 Tax=Streptomyces sp. NPDC020951 TaxID=3365104 RepID=UPI0037B528C9
MGTRTAVAAAAALLTPTTAEAHTQVPASAPQRHAPGDTITLPVQDESRTGYSRALFRHWIDADRDGCSTRAEVLLEEAVTAPEQGPTCTLNGDAWHSPYDDTAFTQARALDIDHPVPLAESWDSGASAWTPAERQAYANGLDDPRALIAVSAASNRSKSDQDPATWQPPAEGYRCAYATDWIAVKTRWDLALDPTEQATLTQALDGCPDTIVEVTRDR